MNEFNENQDQALEDKPSLKEEGCFCAGLYLEGCSIDPNTFQLVESEPKEIYKKLPVILFKTKGDKEDNPNKFQCPI